MAAWMSRLVVKGIETSTVSLLDFPHLFVSIFIMCQNPGVLHSQIIPLVVYYGTKKY